MDRILALAAVLTFMSGAVALADTTVEHSSVSGGGDSNSTTVIHQDNDAPRPVVVQPTVVAPSAPTIQKTKFKEKRTGLFHDTKVKGETTTITP